MTKESGVFWESVLCPLSRTHVIKQVICKTTLIGMVLFCLTIGSIAYGGNISTTNVNGLYGLISGERGRPTVVVLFSSGCSLSKKLWTQLLDFSQQVRDKDISFLIFSTDKSKTNIDAFISKYTLLFNCFWIEPWSPGHLDASMKPLGIKIGKSFTLPLVAVLDSKGKVVNQWQGLTNISQVEKALESIQAL